MRRTWPHSAELVAVLATISLVPVLASRVPQSSHWASSVQGPVPPQFQYSERPYTVEPMVEVLFPKDSSDCASIQSILRSTPSVPLTGPAAIHLLRAYRMSTLARGDVKTGTDIIRHLTGLTQTTPSNEALPFVKTRSGIRFRAYHARGAGNQLGESHRDLFLATFAELGVPLSTSLANLGADRVELSDALRDSVTHFHLDQDPIEWTSIAYVLYMAGAAGWSNCDGDRFTFDQLASELLHRDMSRCSCGGGHVLSAMTLLVRTNDDLRFLSPRTAAELEQRLASEVSTAIATQSEDGSWAPDWQFNPSIALAMKAPGDAGRFLTTSHLVEWMVYLPHRLQPKKATYVRASAWLLAHIRSIDTAPTGVPNAELCPWTHAVCALRAMCPSSTTRPAG